jgi:hypothetical protein
VAKKYPHLDTGWRQHIAHAVKLAKQKAKTGAKRAA